MLHVSGFKRIEVGGTDFNGTKLDRGLETDPQPFGQSHLLTQLAHDLLGCVLFTRVSHLRALRTRLRRHRPTRRMDRFLGASQVIFVASSRAHAVRLVLNEERGVFATPGCTRPAHTKHMKRVCLA